MPMDKEIARIAKLMGDSTRANILTALMAGKALTAGELAICANISPQTASNHLKKLSDAKLIEVIKTPTRYRYYRISSPLVASALEALSLLGDNQKKPPPRHHRLDKNICFARSCYDHLAGTLGVKTTAAMLTKKILQPKDNYFILTTKGEKFFKSLGVEANALQKQRRQFAKPCLDWTEREFHLAGSLGAAWLDFLLNERLVTRSKHRALILTTKGSTWLREHLGINR